MSTQGTSVLGTHPRPGGLAASRGPGDAEDGDGGCQVTYTFERMAVRAGGEGAGACRPVGAAQPSRQTMTLGRGGEHITPSEAVCTHRGSGTRPAEDTWRCPSAPCVAGRMQGWVVGPHVPQTKAPGLCSKGGGDPLPDYRRQLT